MPLSSDSGSCARRCSHGDQGEKCYEDLQDAFQQDLVLQCALSGRLSPLNQSACREFEEQNRAEIPGTHSVAREHRALQKACAWYQVTYSPAWSGYGPAAALSTRELDARLISFPWILTEYLAEIKRVAKCLEEPP